MTLEELVQDILPSNATSLERAAVEALFARLDALSLVLDTLWNPITCPVELLPFLAWALSADEWDATWSEQSRRAYLAAWPEIVRQKGTRASVERALAAAGYGTANVDERFGWDFYNGAEAHDGAITHNSPDHWAEYRVILIRPITIEQAAQVRRILANVAPAHCHLKALDFTEALNIYDARIAHDGQFTHGVA